MNQSNGISVALIGHPNCGKTTLFNALTGKHQRIGNWPGVTVEKKHGFYLDGALKIEVVDLPGCYSPESLEDSALDEQITHEFILSNHAKLFINVVDATELERHLHLTLQLIERGLPIIVALNRIDALQKQKKSIDLKLLEERLGCPVVAIAAIKNQGIKELKAKIKEKVVVPFVSVQNAKTIINNTVEAAKARFNFIQTLLLTNHTTTHTTKTEKIDNILLHRLFGIPLFLFFMYCVFMFSIQIGGLFQGGLDIAARTFFVDMPEYLLNQLQAPDWLLGLLAFGVGQGINTTLSFVPVIGCMFLCLSFLEASGYMSRVAFVMDKVMQWVGLPGKSFVPLIVGFGCNVPGVMATRTLENNRERILTILMTPFMSCGARLAIYALFVSAFFPEGGQNIIFGLYLIGIIVALITGFILRWTLLPGKASPLIIELPPYQWPSLKSLVQTTWYRLKRFILKAGVVIVLLSMVMGTLGSMNHWLMRVGQSMTPLFAPMGLKAENWPATVGLLTGVLAKEVVVGTLNTLYLQELHWSKPTNNVTHATNPNVAKPDSVSIGSLTKNGLTNAFTSVVEKGSQLGEGFLHPLSSNVKTQFIDKSILGIMVERFGSTASAFAYLLFVLLYFPCISVVASIYRELNRFWAIFAVVWTTGVAYAVSVIFYQSTLVLKAEHRIEAIAWIIGCLGVLGLWLLGMRRYAQTKDLQSGYSLNQGINRGCRQMKKGWKPLPTPIILEN